MRIAKTKQLLEVGPHKIVVDDVKLGEAADEPGREVLLLNKRGDYLYGDLPVAYDTFEQASGGFFDEVMWSVAFMDDEGELESALMLDDVSQAERIAALLGYSGWPKLVQTRDMAAMRERQVI